MYLTCTQNDLSAHGLVFKSLVIQFCLIISCSDYEYKHTFIEIFQKKKLKTFLIDVPDMPVISLTCAYCNGKKYISYKFNVLSSDI